ncbi:MULTISPECIES: hypothetical protein [Kosakonia]|uniref:Uncharacterized protein n=1 Tax=Kosakonia quasisacchari TaxID=2529380 RepID=A0A4R0H0V8_9ENTR|nr:hypothetical protein [Kosakonia quasisacchari]TCC02150.1 hypothetical protein E0L21_17910 [Kosakonia quasisacchari]
MTVFITGLVIRQYSGAIDDNASMRVMNQRAKNSALHGLFAVAAIGVGLPGFYAIEHWGWLALKYIGLKIRYFYHGD